MEYRTDLALEYPEPTSQRVEKRKNCTITRIRENGADYITLEVPAISDHIDSGDELLHQLRDELAPCSRKRGWCSWRASGTGDHPGRPGPTDRRAGIGNAAHPRGNRTHHRIGRPAPGGGGQHRRVGMHRRRNQGTPDRIGAGIPALRGDRGGRPRRAQPGGAWGAPSS